MKTTAFICEFNPLHDGHRHFIEQARAQSGADYLIALMSGDFVQRGEPAILPMHGRARTALEAGADLVLQLPDTFATGSAAYFAEGGVRILADLGCVDALAFGAECDDPALLTALAAFVQDNHAALQPLIRRYVGSGLSYAAARAQAALDLLDNCDTAASAPDVIRNMQSADIAALMARPNDQLALAYMAAVRELDLKMTPVIVHRDPSFASSSEIRKDLLADSNAQKLLCADDFSLLLKDRLMSHSVEELSTCLDITSDLAHRIKNNENAFLSWSRFCELLHTKEMTYARISRCLCHVLLGIKKDDPLLTEGTVPKTRLTRSAPFVRILGFRRSASPLLSRIKETAAVAIHTRLPRDLRDVAGDLYESVRTDKYGLPFIESHQQQAVIV